MYLRMGPRMHFLDLQGLYVFWTAGVTTVEYDFAVAFFGFSKEGSFACPFLNFP